MLHGFFRLILSARAVSRFARRPFPPPDTSTPRKGPSAFKESESEWAKVGTNLDPHDWINYGGEDRGNYEDHLL